jgi:hypothetical protein
MDVGDRRRMCDSPNGAQRVLPLKGYQGNNVWQHQVSQEGLRV